MTESMPNTARRAAASETFQDVAAGQARAPARDISARFGALCADGVLDPERTGAAFQALRPLIEPVHFVLVPPFLSDTFFAPNVIGVTTFLSGLEPWMTREGLKAVTAPLGTQNAVHHNAEALTRFLDTLEGPICLIGHSKGGLDSLDCLLRAGPELRAKIIGLMSFQSPFYGSPVADLVSANAPTIGLGAAFRALGGNIQSLEDLRTVDRSGYMARHDPTIAALIAERRHLAFATWEEPSWQVPAGSMANRYMLRKYGRNDRLVTVDSAVLPYGRYAVTDAIGHGGFSILPDRIGRHARAAFHQALLVLLFS